MKKVRDAEENEEEAEPSVRAYILPAVVTPLRPCHSSTSVLSFPQELSRTPRSVNSIIWEIYHLIRLAENLPVISQADDKEGTIKRLLFNVDHSLLAAITAMHGPK